MAIGVGQSGDGVLRTSRHQQVHTYFIFLNIALPGQTHCWLFGQTVTGGHFQVSLWHKGVGIVCQLVARQRRRRAIGVRMVHHGTVVVVPIGVCRANCQQ